SAMEKGLVFRYSIGEGLPAILHGDEKRIRQCIINLLNNAVKYTTKGEVVFNVGSNPVDKTHMKLHISVRDSGIGIRQEDIEKLSVPFERVDGSRNYNVEGTGLGLNIVKNLLALMGSKLVIKSDYGHGSEFAFDIVQEIPLIADGRDENRIADATVDESSESLKTQNASILVVDDTSVNLQLVKLFLKDSMIVTDTAQDGATALVMAAEKKYDIIFIDRRMPVMDGYEVFRRIKGDTAGVNADSVFILLTADEGNDIREEAIAEGFTDYLSKPFDASTLEKMVRKYLQEEKIVTHNT
ncbi:MAG: response regulator, partial [Lachnospiraceae bacterium]|nr:response regulator [Lachnospiraceae bacterium]